jgi:hypothetical protein
MAILKDFLENLQAKMLKRLAIVALLSSVIVYIVLGYYFLMSGDPVSAMESQLSFSDMFLRSELMRIINVEAFKIAQGIDYGFMVSYGLLIFSLALIIGRKFADNSNIRNQSYFFSMSGPIAACADAVENLFIFLTVADPSGFPAWEAIAMSIAAAMKWILLFTTMGWAVAVVVYYFVSVNRKK